VCSSLSAKEGTFLEAPFKPSHVYVWIMFMKKVAKIVQNKISPNFRDGRQSGQERYSKTQRVFPQGGLWPRAQGPAY